MAQEMRPFLHVSSTFTWKHQIGRSADTSFRGACLLLSAETNEVILKTMPTIPTEEQRSALSSVILAWSNQGKGAMVTASKKRRSCLLGGIVPVAVTVVTRVRFAKLWPQVITCR